MQDTEIIRNALKAMHFAHGNPALREIAEQMENDEQSAVALLQDSLKDGMLTQDDLYYKYDMPKKVVKAVVLLTKTPEDTWQTYIRKVSRNNLARLVLATTIDYKLETGALENRREIRWAADYLWALEPLDPDYGNDG